MNEVEHHLKKILEKKTASDVRVFVFMYKLHEIDLCSFYISILPPSKMKSFVSGHIFGRPDRETVCIMSGRSKWVTVLFMRSFVSFKSLLPRCWHWTWVISNKQVLQKIESLEGRKSWAQERHSPATCFSRCIWEALLIALFPVVDFS